MVNQTLPCPFPECDGELKRNYIGHRYYLTCLSCAYDTPERPTPEAALEAAKRVRVLPEGYEPSGDVEHARYWVNERCVVRFYNGAERDTLARLADMAELSASFKREAERCREGWTNSASADAELRKQVRKAEDRADEAERKLAEANRELTERRESPPLSFAGRYDLNRALTAATRELIQLRRLAATRPALDEQAQEDIETVRVLCDGAEERSNSTACVTIGRLQRLCDIAEQATKLPPEPTGTGQPQGPGERRGTVAIDVAPEAQASEGADRDKLQHGSEVAQEEAPVGEGDLSASRLCRGCGHWDAAHRDQHGACEIMLLGGPTCFCSEFLPPESGGAAEYPNKAGDAAENGADHKPPSDSGDPIEPASTNTKGGDANAIRTHVSRKPPVVDTPSSTDPTSVGEGDPIEATETDVEELAKAMWESVATLIRWREASSDVREETLGMARTAYSHIGQEALRVKRQVELLSERNAEQCRQLVRARRERDEANARVHKHRENAQLVVRGSLARVQERNAARAERDALQREVDDTKIELRKMAQACDLMRSQRDDLQRKLDETAEELAKQSHKARIYGEKAQRYRDVAVKSGAVDSDERLEAEVNGLYEQAQRKLEAVREMAQNFRPPDKFSRTILDVINSDTDERGWCPECDDESPAGTACRNPDCAATKPEPAEPEHNGPIMPLKKRVDRLEYDDESIRVDLEQKAHEHQLLLARVDRIERALDGHLNAHANEPGEHSWVRDCAAKQLGVLHGKETSE